MEWGDNWGDKWGDNPGADRWLCPDARFATFIRASIEQGARVERWRNLRAREGVGVSGCAINIGVRPTIEKKQSSSEKISSNLLHNRFL